MQELTKAEADAIISEKLKHVPKPWKRLLSRCLTYDRTRRIKDGAQLDNEVATAIDAYTGSARWRQRWYTTAAVTIAMAVAATMGGMYALEVNNNASQRAAHLEKERDFERKMRIIRLSQRGISSSDDFHDHNELGELQGWLEKFKDPKTAYAAYIDVDNVYNAVTMTGGKTDYAALKPILTAHNDDYATRLYEMEGAYIDGWARGIHSERARKVDEIWKSAGERYHRLDRHTTLSLPR
ncbi:MAG: hypothetical protein AABY13_05220 [Nanoarchaeota archaeon]